MTAIGSRGAPISSRGVVIDKWYDYYFPGAQAVGFTAQIASSEGVLGPLAFQPSAANGTLTLQDGIGGGPTILSVTVASGLLAFQELAVRYKTGLFLTLSVTGAMLIFAGHRE